MLIFFHEEPVSSERTGRPVIETSVIQARSSEDRKDSNVKKAHERTRRLVSVTNTESVLDGCPTRSCHESIRFKVGDKTLRERTERPVIDHDDLSHEKMMVNEADMDFRQGYHILLWSMREMIQKNENHPDRHALQQDLRQNQAYNPFSPESKKMIPDVGNIELCELLETEPKTQCTACLSYLEHGHPLLHMRAFLEEKKLRSTENTEFSMDLLSVPVHVIKKGRAHGHRYDKKPGDK